MTLATHARKSVPLEGLMEALIVSSLLSSQSETIKLFHPLDSIARSLLLKPHSIPFDPTKKNQLQIQEDNTISYSPNSYIVKFPQGVSTQTGF